MTSRKLLTAFVVFAALAATGVTLAARTRSVQPGGTATLAGDLLKDWEAQKDTMMKIADAMPEDKFTYKTTPPQRDYGQQIMHVVGANINLMKILDAKITPPTINMKATTKADILKALADSYDFGSAILKAQTDATLQQTVQAPKFLGPSTRVRIVAFTLAHTMDIYGQMAVYLRLNGIVPPASRGI